MMRLVKYAAGAALVFLSGCGQKDTAVTEEYGKVVSVDGDKAVLSVQDAHGNNQEVILSKDEEVTILKNNCVIIPSSLKPDEEIMATYKDGNLQVIQVIEN